MEDLILEAGEIRMLGMFREHGTEWVIMPDISEYGRECVDMLVLSGLVERRVLEPSREWLDQWRLTEAGAAIINLSEMRAAGDLLDRPGEA